MRRQLLGACGALIAFAAAAQVSIQEYPLPPGLGAHDVWADPAPGGPVWFSAQASGQRGRLDPASGKVELIDLGPRSAPHGVILGPDGGVWLTDGGRNAIMRVDPQTRKVSAWPLPGSGYANLNTALFDRTGMLWFIGQSGVYGRLDPARQKFEVFRSSSERPNVRQIHGRRGEVWTPGSGADKIVVYRFR